MKTMNLSTAITMNICDNLLGKVLKAKDVEVSINDINHLFLTTFQYYITKIKRSR